MDISHHGFQLGDHVMDVSCQNSLICYVFQLRDHVMDVSCQNSLICATVAIQFFREAELALVPTSLT
jgi:hypothetical protein